MFRIFYANKDATLYEAYPTYNTGLDEILEVGKRLGTDGSSLLKSRAVVKFDMTEISASLSKYSKNLPYVTIALGALLIDFTSFADSNNVDPPNPWLTSDIIIINSILFKQLTKTIIT